MSRKEQGMKGKVCLVTGATNGIGFVSARALVRMGAEVVLVGRSQERCQAAIELIEWERRQPPAEADPTTPEGLDAPATHGKASYLLADLANMSQVRQVAEAFLAQHDRLDVLVNNVGGTFLTQRMTEEGLEMTWALNHMSYFWLTKLLLGSLKKTASDQGEARVVSVSSAAHRGGKIRFDNLQGEKGFNGWQAYAQSKLANVLFAFELARRLQGTGVTSNTLHPGYVATGFGMNNGRWMRFILRLGQRFAISPEEGAETTIFLASSPQVRSVSGCYFARCHPTAAAPAAYDSKTARQLWEVSEKLLDNLGV